MVVAPLNVAPWNRAPAVYVAVAFELLNVLTELLHVLTVNGMATPFSTIWASLSTSFSLPKECRMPDIALLCCKVGAEM